MIENKKKYIELVLKLGGNIKKGDKLYITSPVEVHDFTSMMVERAYQLGAVEVIVDYKDDVITRSKYLNEAIENFNNVKSFDIDKSEYIVDNNFKIIGISATDPNMLNGVDGNKISNYNKAYYKACKKRVDYTMGDFGSWTVISVPTKAWANQVFPNKENAVDLLWEEILKATRSNLDDPISAWNQHINKLTNVADMLNEKQFDRLKFKNNKGTNLEIKLVKNHIWAAASSVNNTDGSSFVANIPTEEVFTMPHKDHINGYVYSTKPLVYNGNKIDEFWLKFENGKVVDFDAKLGYEVLKEMLDMDEGAKSLGEVALVSYSSPINLSNILFYNTLFDENASCHLALGRAYPTNLENGVNMSDDSLSDCGANTSSIHVDFMFGSKDMNVVAIDCNGNEEVIFENGEFK